MWEMFLALLQQSSKPLCTVEQKTAFVYHVRVMFMGAVH